jgi:hypothetical protein
MVSRICPEKRCTISPLTKIKRVSQLGTRQPPYSARPGTENRMPECEPQAMELLPPSVGLKQQYNRLDVGGQRGSAAAGLLMLFLSNEHQTIIFDIV